MRYLFLNISLWLLLHSAVNQGIDKNNDKEMESSVLLILEECYNLTENLLTKKNSSIKQDLIRFSCNASFPSDQCSRPVSSESANCQILEKKFVNHSFVVPILSCNNFLLSLDFLKQFQRTQIIPYLFPSGLSKCHNQMLKDTCYGLLKTHERIKMFLISWFVHQGWINIVILYGRTLYNIETRKSFRELVRSVVVKNIKLSFIPIASLTENAPEERLKPLQMLLRSLKRRDIVVIGSKKEIDSVLKIMVAQFTLEERRENYLTTDWLFISNEGFPTLPNPYMNRETFYYLPFPETKSVGEQAVEAFDLGVSLAEQNASSCHSTDANMRVQVPSLTVFAQPVNYSSFLVPPVDNPPSPNPSIASLVPIYEWKPAPEESSSEPYLGTLTPLPLIELYDLQGIELRVATVSGSPFMEFAFDKSEKEKSSDSASRANSLQVGDCEQPTRFFGFLKQILDILSQGMNFTYVMYKVCDGEYGSRLPDGSWTGVVKELVEGRAHVGLANLAQSLERSNAVDFPSVSMSYGGAGILMKRPNQNINDMFSVYLMPFHFGLWFCILAFIPASAVFMFIVTRSWKGAHRLCPKTRRIRRSVTMVKVKAYTPPPSYSAFQRAKRDFESIYGPSHQGSIEMAQQNPAESKTQDVALQNTDQMNLFACLWFSLTAMMQQGQPHMPKRIPSRLVFLFVWISSVVLYAAYTSNLVSFFTVTRITLPINNIQELVASDMKFGTRTGSIYKTNLKDSSNPVHQSAYSKLQSFEAQGEAIYFDTYEEAIDRILNGSYALIADYVVLDYYQKSNCDLVLLKEQLFKQAGSFALPRDSPLLVPFSYFLSRLRDGGVMDELQSKWWKTIPCEEDDNTGSVTSYKPLGINEVLSAFGVLAVGIGLGLLFWLVEYSSAKVTLLQDVVSSDSESSEDSDSGMEKEKY